MADTAPPGRPEILDRIRREIRRDGPISFARFMELALHHPEYGYYARGGARLGPGGDFFTAADVGPAFGRCVASQLAEMDRMLGSPAPFDVVELGGGRGLLARDVTESLRGSVGDRLRYVVADSSPGMRRDAGAIAPDAEVVAPERLSGGRIGCLVAVELFDALPVHRIVRRGGLLREIRVGASGPDETLSEVETAIEAGSAVEALARRYRAAPGEGDEAEVCPALREQLARMAACLERGFAVIVDYGHDAERLHGPSHNRGTLLAYHRHRANEDYLRRVGEQDLTAHVNLSWLEDAARDVGFEVLGRTTQDRFLIAHGILRPFEETDAGLWNEPDRVRERLRVLQLVHPSGMGRIFHVVILGKGVSSVSPLTGLRDPFARS